MRLQSAMNERGAIRRGGRLRSLLRRLGARPRLPMIYQVEMSECSLACLAMVLGYHGREASISEIRSLHAASLHGLSLRTLVPLAARLGLHARALRCDVPELTRVATPALLHWNLEHFVVLERASRHRFVVHDPSRGVRTLDAREMSNHFTGVAIELYPADDFVEARRERKLTVGRMIGAQRALPSILVGIFALSAVLETLALGQPLVFRALVDAGLGRGDGPLLRRIIAVLTGAALLHGATSAVRDYAVLRAGTFLHFHLARRLLRHTLSLPLSFFEKRPIGAMIERYRVTNDVERFLVTSMPLGMIDGAMTVLSLTILFLLSPRLALVAAVTALALFLAKFATYREARAAEEGLVWAKGAEGGHLIETFRTIFTTKASAVENNRLVAWLGLHGKLTAAQLHAGVVDVVSRAARHVMVGLNLAALILVAVAGGGVSVGTLLATLVYNAHFVARASLLADRLFEYRLLGVRLERLEDIVFTAPEEGSPASLSAEARGMGHGGRAPAEVRLRGEIALRDIHYQYAPDRPAILNGATCHVAPGEMIALVGENGVGKTTLMKLLLGLNRPTTGEVLFDGVDLATMPLSSVRAQVGVVTQDDHFLNGTIGENIAFFDPEMDWDRVAKAAELACVREDIERMPLGFRTRASDLGTPFSEGQKQKIFLARALYRNPAILIMDEGTANIDAATEERILANLSSLPATKVLIAHRAATIRRADRVLLLRGGRITEVSKTAYVAA